jgi:catechol 2,3-dioxygenase-like lactoylglutathione lyase family enzyme
MGHPGNDRRIDNIEFAVSDIARSRAFYGKAFGWTFTDFGPTYCEFSDGRLTGGLAKGGPLTGLALMVFGKHLVFDAVRVWVHSRQQLTSERDDAGFKNPPRDLVIACC